MDPIFSNSAIYVTLTLLTIFSSFNIEGVSGAGFTVINRCGHTVWPGILANAGSPAMDSTGFELPPGASRSFQSPPNWSGRSGEDPVARSIQTQWRVGSCLSTGCITDLNQQCPAELRIGSGEACKSACEAFGSPDQKSARDTSQTPSTNGQKQGREMGSTVHGCQTFSLEIHPQLFLLLLGPSH
ncbi:hypothetical protein GH714_006660 [Hevea brasiliensis]|uniref:Thaumatin-like protein n=1 Tax=Hevea brasiliensis TaxID=3981 RepID=A0A6A6M8R0_HEVBR|nr:hypothetical protein GH714_006660 [Hevea brasiliensis]